MHVLVGCCFSVIRKVQLGCWPVLAIIVSSKLESYNMKVVDNVVLYVLRKFHNLWMIIKAVMYFGNLLPCLDRQRLFMPS